MMLSLMIITNMVRIIFILANDDNQCLVSQLDLHIMYTSFRAQPPLSSSGMSQVTLSHCHILSHHHHHDRLKHRNFQYHPHCQNNQSHPNQQCQRCQECQLLVFICICTPRLPVALIPSFLLSRVWPRKQKDLVTCDSLFSSKASSDFHLSHRGGGSVGPRLNRPPALNSIRPH